MTSTVRFEEEWERVQRAHSHTAYLERLNKAKRRRWYKIFTAVVLSISLLMLGINTFS